MAFGFLAESPCGQCKRVFPNWSKHLSAIGSSIGMKTVQIFSDCIRDQIRLEGFRSLRIRVWTFNIRYRIRIRILKSYIYDVDIQLYLIRHNWQYPYSNPNPTRNMKINMILMISVRIRSVFISTHGQIGALNTLVVCTVRTRNLKNGTATT